MKQNIERIVSYNQSQKLESEFLNHVSAGNMTYVGSNASLNGLSDGVLQVVWDS